MVAILKDWGNRKADDETIVNKDSQIELALEFCDLLARCSSNGALKNKSAQIRLVRSAAWQQ